MNGEISGTSPTGPRPDGIHRGCYGKPQPQGTFTLESNVHTMLSVVTSSASAS